MHTATFYIIGIGNKAPIFTPQQLQYIQNSHVFSGGKRHYELVKKHLPTPHQWIPIQSPMEAVFEAYNTLSTPIVVFASGNPLYYGFANTLRTAYPTARIITSPYFSSIQLLATATNTNTNQLQTVSVHGRTWHALDAALIQQKECIGILTDRSKNPATIAQRMLSYGYTNYEMIVGEDIEGTNEKFHTLALSTAATMQFHSLNCVLLKKKSHRTINFGIPDTDFLGLPNRPNMITKMPIRLTTLHLLDIQNQQVVWDIGFCTGAISIEAKLKNPHLTIIAFEKRAICADIIATNQKRFGTPGIETVIGDFFEQDLSQYPKPDSIFIGGHGGRLIEMLQKIAPYLKSTTTIVINAVQDNTIQAFKKGCTAIQYTITNEMLLTIAPHNPITLLSAKSTQTTTVYS